MADKTDETTGKYAAIAREYLNMKKVYRYHLKKVAEMDDREIISVCHRWYEERHLTREYRDFEAERLGIR